MNGIAEQAGPGRPLTVITGGSRGIGHHLVHAFLDDGDVLNISRRPSRAEPPPPHMLHNLSHDLQDVTGVQPALAAWFNEHPGHEVTTLIHNAATLHIGWLDRVGPDEVEHAFRVNVHAPLALTTAIHRAGRLCPAGARIVYVVSSLGRPREELSFAGLGLYSATKAALGRLAMVQGRELELAAPHVKVLRIHPGIVDTEMQTELRQDDRLDPAFATKTAHLPPYREGDWDGRPPADNMRTIPPGLAAEFIVWAVRAPVVDSREYDFYQAEEFHAARSANPVS